MTDKDILWINAGGTIVSKAYEDPHHPPKFVEVLGKDESIQQVKDAIERTGHGDRIDMAEPYYPQDSQLFSNADIRNMADLINESKQKLILITHGTDGMAKNAQRLKARLHELGVAGKTVIFTGAMVPLSMSAKHQSDATDNIRFAVQSLDEQNPGVYMVGRDTKTKRYACVDPEFITKNARISGDTLQFTFNTPDEPIVRC